jgi:hypothetical protein
MFRLNICKFGWHQKIRRFFFIFFRNNSQLYSRSPPSSRRHTNTSYVLKFCYQLVYCLIRYLLVRISIAKCFTNSSRRFRCEQCSRMNTRHAREYTMFAPTQPLCCWREQRPSNQADLDSCVTGEDGTVCYTGLALLLISFLYRSTWLFSGCVLMVHLYTVPLKDCQMTDAV